MPGGTKRCAEKVVGRFGNSPLYAMPYVEPDDAEIKRMRLLINSDRLFATYLIQGSLPGPLRTLLRACREKDVSVVLPETALLEFDRVQKNHYEKKSGEIEKAYDALDRYDVKFNRVDPDELVTRPNLPALIRGLGVDVAVVSPTFEELAEAHRRACMHAPPQPPDAKSDEMRDLVIWMIAVNQARNGGAVLLSGDVVHTHSRGDEEARSVGLVRATNVDDVLEILEVETPAGHLVREFLDLVWDDLTDAELPLAEVLELRGVSGESFTLGTHGFSGGRFTAKVGGIEGQQVHLRCVFHIRGGLIRQVVVEDFAVDEEWMEEVRKISVERSTPVVEDDLEDRLDALQNLLRSGP